MSAEIIGGSQNINHASDDGSTGAGREIEIDQGRARGNSGNYGGRGADGGEYVEYNLGTKAYDIYVNAPPRCPTGLQFPAPWAEGYGYYDEEVRSFEIVDTVIVPDLPGEYLLSWRWDNEQSPQIWSSCADIIIAAADSAEDAESASSSLSSLRPMSPTLALTVAAFHAMCSN